jgi:hypothetical protein
VIFKEVNLVRLYSFEYRLEPHLYPDISTNISVQEAFGPIMSSIINIFAYENGTWRVYPYNPQYSALTIIKPWQGLWLNMHNSETIAFMPKTYNSIYLAKGWNLVRFTLPLSQDIRNAISSIYGNVVSIWTYQDGKWMVMTNLILISESANPHQAW